MEKVKTITPQERARQAAIKRRVAESSKRAAANSGYLYPSLVILVIAVWGNVFYQNLTYTPPVKPIGDVTAARVQLRDGRHVAYEEVGASASSAEYNVLLLHAWQECRVWAKGFGTQAMLEGLGVRLVAYDRPGYGQSDPHPQRTLQSEAEDIAEIADLLRMGEKFHILSVSLGGYAALAGVTMAAPAGSFWAQTQKGDEAEAAWKFLVNPDRYTILVAHHAPAVLHWWMSQRLVKRGSWSDYKTWNIKSGKRDMELLAQVPKEPFEAVLAEALRQGPVESIYRDLKLTSGDWGFDISEIDLSGEGPFEGTLHIWQGADDWIVPPPLQRYAKRVLPAIAYHELSEEGHLFLADPKYHRPILTELIGAGGKEGAPLPDQVLKTA
eukprot:jgi/Mesen1/4211/ME000219S03343